MLKQRRYLDCDDCSADLVEQGFKELLQQESDFIGWWQSQISTVSNITTLTRGTWTKSKRSHRWENMQCTSDFSWTERHDKP